MNQSRGQTSDAHVIFFQCLRTSLLSYHTFRHSRTSIRSSPRAFRSGVINRFALRKASYLAGQISKALTGVRRGSSALEMGLFADAVKVWGNSGESHDLYHFWQHLHYLWPRRTPHRLPRPAETSGRPG